MRRNKKELTGYLVDGPVRGIRAEGAIKSSMTAFTGSLGHLHFIAIGITVAHNFGFAVTINTPEPLFPVNVFWQVMIIQTVGHGGRVSLFHGRAIGAAVIMLKKTLIISAHVVLIMTVEALGVGNIHGEHMFCRIALEGWINGRILSSVPTIIFIDHVTSSTTRSPVEAFSLGAGRMNVTPKTPSPQKIIHQ
jgi:hypothetical protein